MPFDEADYQRASARTKVPVPHVKAVTFVESSGETFWDLGGRQVVPVRFEAHWFGKLTRYRFNVTHPDISSQYWNPALAACTRAGAWEQLERARALDPVAADESTSWGAFQVMGFHWKRLGYPSVQAFVASMDANGDDGQMDAFAEFVNSDPQLQRALQAGDWPTVETLYNGGGQGGAYAKKLADAALVFTNGGPAIVPRAMKRGDRGPDVSWLQVVLGVPVTGTFDDVTDAAVRRVQGLRGLVVDGIAGAMTRRALSL